MDKKTINVKNAVLAASAVLLTAGQVLFFSGLQVQGLALSLAAVLFTALLFPRIRGAIAGIKNGLFIALFAAFAAIAVYLASSGTGYALWFFLASAAFLLLMMRSSGGISGLTGIQQESAKPEKWEKYFLILLIAILFFTRMFMPGQYPAGAGGHEGEMHHYVNDLKIEYTGHSFPPNISFPTLVFYQGIFASKFFGDEIGSYRLPSGLWGAAGIIAFYFLARALFSPRAAAFAALLFAASNLHIVQSRWFYAGTILIPPLLAGFAFIIYGIRHRKWYLFFLAGLAAGFALHGYFPGRGAPLIFLAWFCASFVLWRGFRITAPHFLVFWLGFAITGSPVILFALKHPQVYFRYMTHANPNTGQGIGRYIETIALNFREYARVFHFRSDMDYSFQMGRPPILDRVTGALFPPAFFAAFLLFFRPVSAFILLVFFAGMLPAMLGDAGFDHPTQRRMIMALPAVYLFAALSFEALRRAIAPPHKTKTAVIFFILSLTAASAVVIKSSRNFFFDYCGSPYQSMMYGRPFYEGGRFLNGKSGHALFASHFFRSDVAAYPLMPRGDAVRYFDSFDEFLTYSGDKPIAAAVDGFFGYAESFIKTVYPGAEFNVVREERCDMAVTKQELFQNKTEPFKDCTYITLLRAGIDDIRGLKGLNKEDGAGADYAEGVLIVTEAIEPGGRLKGSFFCGGGPVVFEFPEARWELFVEGQKTGSGRQIRPVRGINTIELKSRFAAAEGAAEPFTINENGKILVPLKIKEPYGLYSCHRQGLNNLAGSCHYEKNELFAMRRFYGSEPIANPATVQYRGFIRVPESGVYYFSGRKGKNRMSIKIDGRDVHDSINNIYRVPVSVSLEAGRKYRFEAVYYLEGPIDCRAFVFEYRTEGSSGFSIVPVEWLLRH